MKYKYDIESIKTAVANNSNLSDAMRELGMKVTGGSHKELSKRVKKLEIDTSHFLGQASRRGKTNGCKKPWQELLVLRENSDRRQAARLLRRALVESGREYACVECGTGDVWNKKQLVLEVHHKDGNWLNDKEDNLIFLCPNCHSQERQS